MDARLLCHGESWGWSVEIYRNGGFFGSRRFQLHADASRWAEQERQALEADGWHSMTPER